VRQPALKDGAGVDWKFVMGRAVIGVGREVERAKWLLIDCLILSQIMHAGISPSVSREDDDPGPAVAGQTFFARAFDK